MTSLSTRSFPLEDISVRSEGDGRTVDAYASVFDVESEIHDHDGHYLETIDRSAFNKTIAERGLKFGVFFNHGATLHGTPSERHSMPIGVPLAVRADQRGVFTSTHYHNTPLADEVLEGIRSGAITGQSFSGRMLQSRSDGGRGPYRPRGGKLSTVVRTEIAMREYGPTPMPAYEAAAITGVRALIDSAYGAGAVDLEGLEDLLELDRTDAFRAAVQELVARLRPSEDTTPDEGPEPADTGTSAEGAATAEPSETAHSNPSRARAHARARLLQMGIKL